MVNNRDCIKSKTYAIRHNTLWHWKGYHRESQQSKQSGRIIRRAFQFLTPKVFVPLYKSLVRCHLDNAASVQSPHKIKEVELIEPVQRRATKYLPGFITFEDRLKQLNLPLLAYRRMRGDMIETYKILHKIYDSKVATHLTRADEVVTRASRGHQYKLYKKIVTKQVRLHSFPCQIVTPWNSLPEKGCECPLSKRFQKQIGQALEESRYAV